MLADAALSAESFSCAGMMESRSRCYSGFSPPYRPLTRTEPSMQMAGGVPTAPAFRNFW
jgi:hypothetical protein